MMPAANKASRDRPDARRTRPMNNCSTRLARFMVCASVSLFLFLSADALERLSKSFNGQREENFHAGVADLHAKSPLNCTREFCGAPLLIRPGLFNRCLSLWRDCSRKKRRAGVCIAAVRPPARPLSLPLSESFTRLRFVFASLRGGAAAELTGRVLLRAGESPAAPLDDGRVNLMNDFPRRAADPVRARVFAGSNEKPAGGPGAPVILTPALI